MIMLYRSALRTGISRLSPMAVAALLLLGALTASAQPASTVRGLLDDAAARFGIPRRVLYGIAYNESRWRHVPADSLSPSCTGMPPAIGIMGLRDDDYFGHSLRAGIALGITPEEAAASIEGNITAGGAHLSALFTGSDREAIEDWLPAIGAYSGIPESQPALRLLYIDGVLELLRRGWNIGDQYVASGPVPAIDKEGMNRELEAMGMMPAPAGDFPGAEWRPSPNFSGRGGASISAVTIHDTEGSFAGSLSWLTSAQSGASAHYMIRSVDGFTVQMVHDKDKAWHVRDENPYTIGIEHEGYTTRPEYFTPAMYDASAALTRYLARTYRIPLDRSHIKGHLDFPNNTHTDPGGWWDWPAYFRRIMESSAARVTIDPLEDNVVGWWQPGMSGSTTGVDTAISRLRITSSGAYQGEKGAECSYAFTGSSGGVARFFRSGHGNTSDGLLNVGSNGSVTLAVRGDGSGHELEIWLYDREKGNRIVRAGSIVWSGWRTISVPLAGLGTGGPFRFHSVVLRQSSGKGRTGTIAFDELAHEIGVSSVAEGPETPAYSPRSIALGINQPFPDFMYAAEDISIYSALGELVGRFPRLPESPAAASLAPGFYLISPPNREYTRILVEGE